MLSFYGVIPMSHYCSFTDARSHENHTLVHMHSIVATMSNVVTQRQATSSSTTSSGIVSWSCEHDASVTAFAEEHHEAISHVWSVTITR